MTSGRQKTFGEFIKSQRKENEWTVREFIERLAELGYKKISPAYMTRVEQYGEIPSPEIICGFALVLACSVDELVFLAKQEKVSRFDKALENKYREAVGLYRTQKKKG
jgi:transcriptional regulator with XRE-family HTH domain